MAAALGAIAPAYAVCEREVELAEFVVHAQLEQASWTANEPQAGTAPRDKFALARAHCGDLSPAPSQARERGREARQLSLYASPAPASPAPASPAPASPVRPAPAPRASEGKPTSTASSTPVGGTRVRGMQPSPVRGVAPRGPESRPALQPVRAPSGMTLRVQALADTMARAAARYRLDPLLLHAIASVESKHDASARSHAGAIGVMQVMPDTARRFGVEQPERRLHHPTVNINAGAAYLSSLRLLYQNNLELMLAAYNAGEGAVERYGNRIPPYAETRNYVRRVLDLYGELHRHTGRAAPRVDAMTPTMQPHSSAL